MKHSAFCTLPLHNHICAVLLVLNVLSLLLVTRGSGPHGQRCTRSNCKYYEKSSVLVS